MGILLLTHGDVVFEVDEEPSEPKLSLGNGNDPVLLCAFFVNGDLRC